MRRFFFFLVALVLLTPASTYGATMSVSAARTTVRVGDTVTVSVLVDSTGVAINNAEGALTFPAGAFDVLSVRKTNSIFSLWINDPSYDGNNSVTFNGGLPTPGYTGSSGTLFDVVLRANVAGTEPISITNGAVRANDGLGTDVLTGVSGMSLVVQNTSAAPAPAAPVDTTSAAKPLSAVTIVSPTNPSQDAWYNQRTASFQFTFPGGATALQTILSTSADAQPSVLYKPAISQKRVTDIADGVWYLVVRARVAGAWTDTTAYRLQIDTVPPVATSTFAFDAETQALTVAGAASDALSGVASYEVFVDGATTTSLTPQQMQTGAHIPLHVAAGQHSVVVRVTDQAGNYVDISGAFAASPSQRTSTEAFSWMHSPAAVDLLVVLLTLALLILVAMNIALWLKLTEHKRAAGKEIGAVKDAVKKKTLAYKKTIQNEDKVLQKIHTTKKLTSAEAETLKKARTVLAEITRYIDEKLKELKN